MRHATQPSWRPCNACEPRAAVACSRPLLSSSSRLPHESRAGLWETNTARPLRRVCGRSLSAALMRLLHSETGGGEILYTLLDECGMGSAAECPHGGTELRENGDERITRSRLRESRFHGSRRVRVTWILGEYSVYTVLNFKSKKIHIKTTTTL